MVAPITNNITAARALIFRITHIDNAPWILANGIPAQNHAVTDPNFVSIGNPELIQRRAARAVPIRPGGRLADYIPFYFTPYSPMMYNIKTGFGEVPKRQNREIAILVSSLRSVADAGIEYVFTDRHAYLQTATFYNDLEDLGEVDFALIRTKDFRKDPDDPGRLERYQAEALIFEHLPSSELLGVGCFQEAQRRSIQGEIDANELGINCVVRPSWYF